ncbi:hypothetical protein [Janthinobacterium sp. AD80]|uniref:hypothetical protein n=1 Tax=Janthinobacterium sp. AD80 TaxID=1528773 RepID=UPI0011AF0452|nr:hypothetical protein [Janthinobacterium sp. AD80]
MAGKKGAQAAGRLFAEQPQLQPCAARQRQQLRDAGQLFLAFGAAAGQEQQYGRLARRSGLEACAPRQRAGLHGRQGLARHEDGGGQPFAAAGAQHGQAQPHIAGDGKCQRRQHAL